MKNSAESTEAKPLRVKKARNGKGIFTGKRFKGGSILFVVTGPIVRYMKLYEWGGARQDNAYRYAAETYISPQDKIGDFLNHSCTPNARVAKGKRKLYIHAIADIEKGEEIVIDYSTILAGDDIWTMRCNCGSKECRKIVKNWTKLPRKTLAYYKSTKILPDYIARLPKL